MCDICEDLQAKVRAAVSDGDPVKARVMNCILAGHRKHQHGREVETVTVTPESVIWPGGKVWVVANT